MRKINLIIITLCVISTSLLAAGKLEKKLSQYAEDNAKGYIKPLVTAFGTNVNTGLYNSAKTLKPFHFSISINGMLAFVPDEDKTFTAKSPSVMYNGTEYFLFEEEELETATVFGKDGAYFHLNEELAEFDEFDNMTGKSLPNGGKLDLVPLLTPQINFGLPYGNELLIRAFPKYEINEDTGEISFFGIGLKHSIDQYLPGIIPIDLSLQAVYHHIQITKIMEFNSIAVNAEVSKKLLMWTFYGGLQYEKTTMSADYETEFYNYETQSYDPLKVKFDLEGDNQFRATAGVRYTFLVINLFADYTISKYNVFNAGLGLSF